MPGSITDQYHLLPRVTFHQLEVLRAVYRERSFANAAIDLHGTRGNVKRMCAELEQILGGKLFEHDDSSVLQPTPFAHAMVAQMTPLARSVRKLEESVAAMHQMGRVLRLAASPALFESEWFSGFLRRFRSRCPFRVCCLMLDEKRFRTALLNAGCDVFLGCGMEASDKLEAIALGTVPWRFLTRDGEIHPATPDNLTGHAWSVEDSGDPEAMERLLGALQAAGAGRGLIVQPSVSKAWIASPASIPTGTILLLADSHSEKEGSHVWPSHRYAAFIRRNHPYSELKTLLETASHGI